MKVVSKNDRLRQFGRTTTMALVAGVPMIGTIVTAEAAPPSHAPAWGYRSGQVQYQDRIRQDVSVTGVVTSDLPGDQFDIRADNGRTYRVVFSRRASEPRRISRGDRVTVEGNLDRDILVARDVRILDNRGTGGGQTDHRNFTTTGVVTSDLPGDQFDIRSDDGRTYRVVFHRQDGEPRRLSRGDRVSVDGHLDRDILIAHDVRVLDNRGTGGGWGQNNRYFSTTGIVTRDLAGDQFEFRADNGRVYQVVFPRRANEPRRISRGDLVSVTGSLDRDIVTARDVRILENRGSGGGQYVRNFSTTGVVTSDLPGDQFDIRSENGRIYRVVFPRRANEPRRISRGDRVTVTGTLDRDIVVAHDVRVLDNRGNNDWNERRTLTGVVTRDREGDEFDLRVDNRPGIGGIGRVIRVRVRRDEPNRLSRGDLVTVTGRFTNNDRDRFTAETVRIVENRGNNDWNDRRTLTGVVTRDYSGDNFEMRVEGPGSDRIVRVDARGDEPRRLTRGDLVTVTGRYTSNDRNRFSADSVRITKNR